jgi:protein SCO1/2
MLRLAMAALALMFGLSSGPPSGRLAADELVLDTCSKAQLATLGPAHCYFTDVTLRDHYGQEKRLYSDLLKGKVVVVSSFFTSCVNSCPIVNALLAALQDELGAQFGTKVHFLTITADPVLDTPEILAGYARRLSARPGWHFLTGDERNVDLANYKLGFAVDEPSQHRNVLIIGNEATGLWKKIPAATIGLPELGRIVDDLLHDRSG